MKLEFHSETLTQHYTCNRCGAGCRSFLIPVRQGEQDAVEELADWRTLLGVKDLFVRTPAAGPSGVGLAKHPDGRCVFLDADNLCAIHKKNGLKAKPLACQLYPFVLTPFAGNLRIALRFDCPAVCENSGSDLQEYGKELHELAQKLAPDGPFSDSIPSLAPRQHLSAQQLDEINDVFIKAIGSDAMELPLRLNWAHSLLNHFEQINWKNVSDDEFPELINMLRGGVLAELQRQQPERHPLPPKSRRLLGQLFFILSQPPTVIQADKPPLIDRLRTRLAQVRNMKQMGNPIGPLPRLRPGWPDCDMNQLEHSFGPWPADVQEMLTRYLTCRLAGMNYFGPNFYDYTLIEGMRSMLLAMAAVGYLMRIYALRDNRQHVELPDAHAAVMAIDGNLGYNQALGFGPAKLRLRYLTEHIPDIITCYCT